MSFSSEETRIRKSSEKSNNSHKDDILDANLPKPSQRAIKLRLETEKDKMKFPFEIRGEKQLTRMEFVREVSSMARKANKLVKDEDIFNIDDILVEMALLFANKKSSDLVFYFIIHFKDRKWRIRRNWNQFKQLHSVLSKRDKDYPTLPIHDKDDKDLFLRLTLYLRYAVNQIFDEQGLGIIKEFLGGVFVEEGENQLGHLIKCDFAWKKIGGRYKSSKIWNFFKTHLNCWWRKRYFVLTDEGIGYTSDQTQFKVRDFLLFDKTLKVRVGKHYTGDQYGIVLFTTSRRLRLQVKNAFQLMDWLESIIESIFANPYCEKNIRFDSFAPIRFSNNAQWYVNGEHYYADIARDLRLAKNEVYITDWWLSPEIYLERPVKRLPNGSLSLEGRLDTILKEIANRGVRISILLYKEVEQALPNKSLSTQSKLMSLHSHNISVIRHPTALISFWSHHEKTVTIDQKICYMGGLDLCYGRYDTDDYHLREPDNLESIGSELFPGQDYNNVRIKDFERVDVEFNPLIDKMSQPRMPWRDIAVRLVGVVTKDITRHFIQYWNFAKYESEGGKKSDYLLSKRYKESDKSKKSSNGSKISDIGKSMISEVDNDLNSKIDGDSEEEQSFLFKSTPSFIEADHQFVQPKVNPEKTEEQSNPKRRFTNTASNIIRGLFFKKNNPNEDNQEKQKLNYLIPDKSVETQDPSLPSLEKTSCCQILRSAGNWSMGLDQRQTEHSILNAYLDLISKAKKFVYIENQFFVSSVCGKPVANAIAEIIIQRIENAIKTNSEFMVVVVLPLLPGFTGGIDQKDANLMRIQLNWEYRTINRGKNSILERLSKQTDNPSKYIKFYGLRNHTKMKDGTPVTEMIYIHSKCLIIDDCIALIGSANINDRSMRGNRDSELAVVIEDSKEIESLMGGRKATVKKFAHTLRKQCFKTIFGFKFDQEVQDPLSAEMWTEINQRTNQNTRIYREVFRVYPDDQINKLRDVKIASGKKRLENYDKLKAGIRGFGVEFPHHFLKGEDLKKLKNFEFGLVILPDHTFT